MKTVSLTGGGRLHWCGYLDRVGLILALTVAVSAGSSCSGTRSEGQPPQAAAMPPVPVTVALARLETVPIDLSQIGTVEAYSTVTIKSQVDGQLKTVNFTEGQDVKAGDLLFTVDSRSYEATLAQSEANLARDEAQYANAKAQDARYTALYHAGIVSKDQYDQHRSNADALAATLRADQAAVQNAKVMLGYCTIRSPLTGRTGNLQVTPGNMLKSNDTALVTVNQLSPIYVGFSVPQQNLPEIRAHLLAGRLRVAATVPGGQDRNPESGWLSFVNNTVDSGTGTIMLKGTFQNADRRLWPGQFVNVSLRLREQRNAVVVPSPAVQTGQNTHYVFVVSPDQTVAVSPVVPGPTYGPDTVIQQGIKSGDRVVTDGQLRLFPGAKVIVRSGAATPSPAGAAGEP